MRISYLAGLLPLITLATAGLIERRAATTLCNRDNVFRCLLSASATASPYCSSFLSYGTVTSYTSTVTPTMTSSVSTTQSATVTVTTIETATTTLIDSFSVTTTNSETTAVTVVATTDTTITQTAIPPFIPKREVGAVRIYSEIYGNTALPRNIEARATPSAAPPCLAQYSPAATRISSACSCLTGSLSIKSATIFTISTAPTVTVVSRPSPQANKFVTEPPNITNVDTISTTETDSTSTTATVTTETSTTATDFTTTTVTNLIPSTTTSTLTSTVTQKCADCYLCTGNNDCQAGFECATYIGFSFGMVNLCSNKDPNGKDYTCSAICTN